MSAAVAGVYRPPLARLWPVLAAVGWRRWALALAAGATLGLGNALALTAPLWRSWPQVKLPLLAVISARWVPLLALVACALLLATTLLQAQNRRGTARHDMLWMLAFALAAVVLLDRLCLELASVMHRWLAIPVRPFWAGLDTPRLLLAMWSRSLPAATVMAVMWAVIERHLRGAQRDTQALAAAQLRLAGVQRRSLDEQLRTAQARAEPALLFDTLNSIAERFETAPAQAQLLLDALIRYLRAALPATADAGCTVGQQVDLVRAYLDIETLRADGRLQASIDADAGSGSGSGAMPMAPLLVLPLVAEVVTASDGAVASIAVRFTVRSGRIAVEIDDDRTQAAELERAPVVAELRRRLQTLYGAGAELALQRRAERGSAIRLVIELGTR